MAEYLDLEIEVSGAGPILAVQARSPLGEASVQATWTLAEVEIENFVLKVGRTRQGVRRIESPQIQAAKEFGARLFEVLFQGDVRSLLDRALAQVAAGDAPGVRLILRLQDAPGLADVPWEYLYDPRFNRFFSLSTETPIVRYLWKAESIAPQPAPLPLRILVMISSPTDLPALDVEGEKRRLQAAWGEQQAQGRLEADWLDQADLLTLLHQLRKAKSSGRPYHIFHFIGHGGFDEGLQDGVLALTDNQGRGRPVTGEELGTILYDHRTLRLAVLNACEGARQGREEPFSGVACSLLEKRIPAVVAMQFEITDQAALVLARTFYAALADGLPADLALAEARRAIYASDNDVEWGTPVLYTRVRDGRLFDLLPPTSSPQTETSPKAPPEARRSWPARRWDAVRRAFAAPGRARVTFLVLALLLLLAVGMGGWLLYRHIRPPLPPEGAFPGLVSPYGVAVDAKGRVYVSDYGTHTLNIYSDRGKLLGRWGAQGQDLGQFDRPMGLVLGREDDIYVADYENHRIQRLQVDVGEVISYWGVEGPGDGQFAFPRALAVDPAGQVFVVDEKNHRIQVFDSMGRYRRQWGTYGAQTGQFRWPHGIALSPEGEVYVADFGNARVQVFAPDGTFVRTWPAGGGPDSLAIDPEGRVYVLLWSGLLVVFDAEGHLVDTWTGPEDSALPLVGPGNIALADNGLAYVADMGNARIVTFRWRDVEAAATETPGIGVEPTATLAPMFAFQDVVESLPPSAEGTYPARSLEDIEYLIIHHTGASDAAALETMARELATRADYGGFPYHFVIAADGAVYQTQRLETVTDHSGPWSRQGVGIAFMGDFTTGAPSEVQLQAGGWLIARLLVQLDLPVEQVVGYSELNPSAISPGGEWTTGAAWKNTLIRWVAAYLSDTQSPPLTVATSTPTATPSPTRRLTPLQTAASTPTAEK